MCGEERPDEQGGLKVHLIFYSIWRENIFERIVPKGPSCRISGIEVEEIPESVMFFVSE